MLSSIGLGIGLAWTIVTYFPAPRPTTSYFTLQPWPIDEPNDNLALIGVGLAAARDQPSVMDASPAAPPQPVIMEPAMAASPSMSMIAPGPAAVQMTMATAPAPVAMAPMTMMPPALTPAPMQLLAPSPSV